MRRGNFGDGLHPRDIAGKTGEHDPIFKTPHQFHQAVTNSRLRSRIPVHQRIGGIADHRQNPLVPKPAQRCLVG